MGGVYCVGLSGASCSGKTSIACLLQKEFAHSIVINQDSFYLNETQLEKRNGVYNWDEPKSLNHRELVHYVEQAYSQPHLLCHNCTSLEANHIVIVEGTMVLTLENLTKYFDVSYFITIDDVTCRQRRWERKYNGETDPQDYFDTYLWPSYMQQYNIVKNSAVILDGQLTLHELTAQIISHIKLFKHYICVYVIRTYAFAVWRAIIRAMPLKLEFEIDHKPEDGITCVEFCPFPGSPFLLCSSWDCCLRLYDVQQNQLKAKIEHPFAALDCCFSDASHAFSGGLDRTLLHSDLTTQLSTNLGCHDDTIRCVEYCPEVGVVATGSWDKTVKLWDPRQKQVVGTYDQSGESVYTMDLCGDKLVVGTSNRKVLVWDLKNMQFAEQRRASSLKYQTRTIRCFPNRQGFVLSSIEGRVAVEYLNTDAEIQKKKYAFKCHRVKQEGIEHIYPVNAVSFHRGHNTFATGGSDGFVNIWDPFNKKRLCQFHRYMMDVSSLSFNWEGSMIAIAVSSVWSDGGTSPPTKDTIFIRHVTDNETQPKPTDSH